MRWSVFVLLMFVVVVSAATEMTKEENEKCKSAGGWMAAAMLISGLAAPIVPEVTAFVWLTAAFGGAACK